MSKKDDAMLPLIALGLGGFAWLMLSGKKKKSRPVEGAVSGFTASQKPTGWSYTSKVTRAGDKPTPEYHTHHHTGDGPTVGHAIPGRTGPTRLFSRNAVERVNTGETWDKVWRIAELNEPRTFITRFSVGRYVHPTYVALSRYYYRISWDGKDWTAAALETGSEDWSEAKALFGGKEAHPGLPSVRLDVDFDESTPDGKYLLAYCTVYPDGGSGDYKLFAKSIAL